MAHRQRRPAPLTAAACRALFRALHCGNPAVEAQAAATIRDLATVGELLAMRRQLKALAHKRQRGDGQGAQPDKPGP